MGDRKINVGSMFAGVGGICKGFLDSGNGSEQKTEYHISWANEIDKNACITYRQNFPNTALYEADIFDILNNPEHAHTLEAITSKPIDILNGGFPCQAFSVAGYRKGFDDDRGHLFIAIIKLIRNFGKRSDKPRFLLLENVKNLLTHDKNRTYNIIKEKLTEEGYTVKEKIINTMHYSNLPQTRERLYIMGFLSKKDADGFTLFEDNNLEKYRTDPWISQDPRTFALLDNNVDEKYYYTQAKYPHYYNEAVNLDNDITERGQFYQLRRGMYVRHNKSNVCPTLTANMGTGGHNVPLLFDGTGVRKITPAEAFKLQGFPINNGYILPPETADCHLYKQAGNSVSIPVIKILADELMKLIK